ncbi:MAG: translocation/assembly module TamB [Flavobacteriaceae bacterium]|nr:translocation/assembly module TamB [Flavobacteriaceae bacterium]
MVNDDFGTSITIEKVGLQFNSDIELKNIYVQDYKQDTLFHIKELNTSILSFKKFFEGKLTFGDIDVYGLTFNLKTYSGERDTNLDVFVARFDEEQPTPSSGNFLLSSSDVTIYDSNFKLIDENLETPLVLDFTDLRINATDFLILGSNVSMRINRLGLHDHRGLNVTNLTSNFSYTREQMVFDDLQIETKKSHLYGKLQFDYERKDFANFTDKVKVLATFKDSEVALDELNGFYDAFGNETATFSSVFYGTLNDLHASKLTLNTSGQSLVDGHINFKNIFNKADDSFVMEANFNRLVSTYQDLKSLLPNLLGTTLPASLEKLGQFTIIGDSKITSTTVDVDVELKTDLGFVKSDLSFNDIHDTANIGYSGNVVLNAFDLGRLINEKKLGLTSLDLDVEGKGFALRQLNTHVKGNISDVNFNAYRYSNVAISGKIKNRIFKGNLETKDANIDLKFDGLVDFSSGENHYDFTADVAKLNLERLNFVQRDSISKFKGLVTMDMNGTNLDDAYGSISFKNTVYTNQNDTYFFDDFKVSSRFQEEVRYIEINSPDIIEGSLRGKFVFNDVVKLFENAVGNIYTNYQPHKIAEDQFIDFNFKIYNTIAEVFYKDLKFGSNTFIRGHLESDAKEFRLAFKSPKISLQDVFADRIELRLTNNNPLFNTYVEIDSIGSKYYDISKFSLINVTLKDTLFVKTQFKGGKHNRDDYNLNLFYTINEANNSVIGFKKSEVNFKANEWFINANKDGLNKIVFDRLFKQIEFKNLNLSHKNEEINLSGVLRDSTYKNINLDFRDVDLMKITPAIDSLSLAGNVNGKLKVLQQNGSYIPEFNTTIDNFKVNNFNLGAFRATILGDTDFTNYNVDVSLKEETNESLAVIGNIDISGRDPMIDLDVYFNKFVLNPLNPLGEDVITNIRGEIAGNARVTGRLQRPQINGLLSIDNAGLSIPYLNVDYTFDDNTQMVLREQSFVFNDAQMKDSEYFSRAILNGSIDHVNFATWALNLDITSDRILVLNTEEQEDELYYGTAFVSGAVGIKGPTDGLVIKAEVSSEEGTVFKIPLNDTDSFGEGSYIHFLSPEEKKAREEGIELVSEDIQGLEMDFDLTVNENAEIEIVMDKASGSTIKGRGNGGLLAQINTNGTFNMYGDFIVSEGTYNFIYGGVIQKNFEVVEGGTLAWDGSPLEAVINITAVHKGINANPSVLLDNPINQSIPVEVKIHLTERLEQPDLDFNLSFPNVNTTLNSELQYRLNDRDSRNFQALSLLTTGSFKNQLSFSSQDALGLVSDRVEAMINQIISNNNEELDIGLDLQLGENNPDYETDSRVGVTLSTKLSDRILINGKVGVPIGGINETVVAGNFEVEVILNEDRSLSLKIFNRENNIQYFGEQIGYTQGVGLSYNVEFNTLNELFKKLFSNKNREKIDQKEIQPKSEAQNGLPEYHSFKKKDTIASKTKKIKTDKQ